MIILKCISGKCAARMSSELAVQVRDSILETLADLVGLFRKSGISLVTSTVKKDVIF
jgi:hypothetical protein